MTKRPRAQNVFGVEVWCSSPAAAERVVIEAQAQRELVAAVGLTFIMWARIEAEAVAHIRLLRWRAGSARWALGVDVPKDLEDALALPHDRRFSEILKMWAKLSCLALGPTHKAAKKATRVQSQLRNLVNVRNELAHCRVAVEGGFDAPPCAICWGVLG